MKYTNNIFGTDASGGVFGPDSSFRGGLSAVTVVTLVLTAVSAAAAICLIVNFEVVTARIALWIAGALSSGIAVFLVVGGIVYFILRLKWRMYCSLRRW